MSQPDGFGGFSMLDLFRQEVEDQGKTLSDRLLKLENDPESKEDLETLMRAAHSIKGAARIVQMDAAVKVSHVMEDCFVAAQEGHLVLDEEDIDILLKGVDLLIRVSKVSEPEMTEWLEKHTTEIDGFVNSINDIVKGDKKKKPLVEEEPVRKVEDKAEEKEEEEVHAEEYAVEAEKPEETTKVVQRDPQPEKAKPRKEVKKSSNLVVRVTADNLNRLMGLAGESLVETGWLQNFSDSMMSFKTSLTDLSDGLYDILGNYQETEVDPELMDSIRGVFEKNSECRTMLSDRLGDLEIYSRRMWNLSNRLYREVIASRMRPFSDGVHMFPRMARDLSKKLRKKIRFQILGNQVDVDRDILDKLEAPLTHLIRNAIDHGIEDPKERIKKGKSETGSIKLEACHQAGMLLITVSDDGKGINLDHLRKKIVDKKMVSKEMADKMNSAELMEFIFLSGFSTAGSVTEISGRGVGLDVVQHMVHEVGGTLKAESEFGKWTTFFLHLPLTLSVVRTLIVDIGDEPYAFPLPRIDRTMVITREEIKVVENRQYVSFDDENIGLVSAEQVLELEEVEQHEKELFVVVISDRLNRYGLVVDRFLGEKDLVVKPLDHRLGKVQNLSSAAIMEDGRPVIIVDVDDLVRSIDNLLSGAGIRKVDRDEISITESGRKRILVVDDSITVREVERQLLLNMGYEVDAAVNGMDGWNAVRSCHYDLVVTDVDMPRMNGIELVKNIKGDANLSHLPVIIVSYKDQEEDRIKGLDAGANYYLTKSSFHDETLAEAVETLIGAAKK